MSTNQKEGEISNAHVLQLEIARVVSLFELINQVTRICDQAEEYTSVVVVCRFLDSSKDLKFWPGRVDIQEINRWERAVRRFERLAAVIIAVASGTVSGPALDLLLATDYRIAAEDFWLQIPVNDSQVWPGMAIYRLVNQLGLARSRQLLVGDHEINARKALDIGLIDEINNSTLDAERSAVLKLAPMSSVDFSIRRQLLLEASTTTFEDARGTYLAACDRELRRLRSREEFETRLQDK
jgi:isomerase DpgB